MKAIDQELERNLDIGAVSPSKLAHIVLRTPNFDKMRIFYKHFLNAHAAYEDEFVAFLRYDDEHHRVAIVNMPFLGPPPSDPVAGTEHVAYTFRTLGELLSNFLRLKALEIEPVWCINHGPTTSIYYSDPDANMIETQFDNFNVEEADLFMRGHYFSKNPIGVDFDPMRLIERYQRGDPMEELIRQGSALPPEGSVAVRPDKVPDYDFRGALLNA
jgi:catechol 2,3-dioxygenase-like lactoylglutathione lyase family enzyme